MATVGHKAEQWPTDEEITTWLMARFDETNERMYLFAAGRLTAASQAARYLEKKVLGDE
jgi:hypothetical protein